MGWYLPLVAGGRPKMSIGMRSILLLGTEVVTGNRYGEGVVAAIVVGSVANIRDQYFHQPGRARQAEFTPSRHRRAHSYPGATLL